MMVVVSVWGALGDWSSYRLCELQGLDVPSFNFAISWMIRTILVFSCIGYFAWWTTCSGRRSVLQRAAWWIAMVTCFVAVNVPVLYRAMQSGAAGRLDVAWFVLALSIVSYAVSIAMAQPTVWREVDCGADPSHQHSPVFNVLFLSYPPQRRVDMALWDVLALVGLLYALRGSWLVIE
ncbi:MAG TPA: hypothetical protein VFS47_05435 [Steroidobacteraceae bacterium]|nr:hypothetical protein [Steroidobacteraceae bacterium]